MVMAPDDAQRALELLALIPPAMEEAEDLGYTPAGVGYQEPVSGGKPKSRAPSMGHPMARASYAVATVALRKAERLARMMLRESGYRIDPRAKLPERPYRSQVDECCAVIVRALEESGDRRQVVRVEVHVLRAWQVLAQWAPAKRRDGVPGEVPDPATYPCEECGAPIRRKSGPGRPAVTCSDRCRTERKARA